MRNLARGLLTVALLSVTLASDQRYAQPPPPGTGALLARIHGVGAVFSGTVPRAAALGLQVERSSIAPASRGAVTFGAGLKVRVANGFAGRFQLRLRLPAAPSEAAVPGVAVVFEEKRTTGQPALWDQSRNEVVFWISDNGGRQSLDWFAAWWKPRKWADEAAREAGYGWIGHTLGADPSACRKAVVPWALMAAPASRAPDGFGAFTGCLRRVVPSHDADSVELWLASTHDAFQLRDVPVAARSVRVQGQPPWLRELLPRVAGGRADQVLLAGERSMSFVLERPERDVDIHIRSRQPLPLVVANLVSVMLGRLGPSDLPVALFAAAACFDTHSPGFPKADQARVDLIEAQHLLASMIGCSLELTSSRGEAMAAFERLLASHGTAAERRAFRSTLRAGLETITPTAKRVAQVFEVEGRDISKNFLWDELTDIPDTLTVQLNGKARDALDVRRSVDCREPCWISGRVHLRHPTWGEITLVTTNTEDNSQDGAITAVDSRGTRRWRRSWSGFRQLAPAGVDPDYISDRAVTTSLDSTGNVFFHYNPGRYNGVIVLRPIANGFQDFGSLPAHDDYAGRWYSAEAVDSDDDGVFEIETTYWCHPDCTEKGNEIVTDRWNGRDYVLTSTRPDSAE